LKDKMVLEEFIMKTWVLTNNETQNWDLKARKP
jgi:hypothetical protein